MSEKKFNEIDARLAAIEASLMVHDSLIIDIIKWLAQTPDGEDMRESLVFQLESEAARFASMPVDAAGRLPAISDALRGMATALSHSDSPDPSHVTSKPKLRLVMKD